jgi:hypothetical protein
MAEFWRIFAYSQFKRIFALYPHSRNYCLFSIVISKMETTFNLIRNANLAFPLLD